METSNTSINKIGDVIRRGKEDPNFDKSIEFLNDWRELHGPVMDKYYDKSVKLVKKNDFKNVIVAQRLKRLPTIIGKLNRFKNMRLSSIQDIAGVRIIAEDMEQLAAIGHFLEGWKNLVKVRDYIKEPKESGYRCKHYIFKENNMLVEIQLRTQLQHIWATSVESTDLFRGSSLKEKDDKTCWHDFFCQVSAIFAIAEKCPTPSQYRQKSLEFISEELSENMSRNKIYNQIQAFTLMGPIVSHKELRGAYYLVFSLDFERKEIKVAPYKEDQYRAAFKKYIREERGRNNSSNVQVVFIAVSEIEKVRAAYPNYYLDLTLFLRLIDFILDKYKEK